VGHNEFSSLSFHSKLLIFDCVCRFVANLVRRTFLLPIPPTNLAIFATFFDHEEVWVDFIEASESHPTAKSIGKMCVVQYDSSDRRSSHCRGLPSSNQERSKKGHTRAPKKIDLGRPK
jgi:hypothetical protein